MARPQIHFDADTSIRSLHQALLARGHNVSRTPVMWMPLDASDEDHLLGATAQGRCIFTFNARDFLALAHRHPRHGGIVLAPQSSWTLAGLSDALDCLLTETDAGGWPGQVRCLNQWRSR